MDKTYTNNEQKLIIIIVEGLQTIYIHFRKKLSKSQILL